MRLSWQHHVARACVHAGVLSLFATVAPAQAGTSPPGSGASSGMAIAVSNCNDSGPGSLRDAVARAESGDTIDLTATGCSSIVLTSGAIAVAQNDLTLHGPGRFLLTVSGNNASSVFRHSGFGTLRIRLMSIAHGRYRDRYADGGCIYSSGHVEIRHSQVHHCIAEAPDVTGSSSADGGGIFALGELVLFNSEVFSNQAHAQYGGYGGGVISHGRMTIDRSKLYRNQATGRDGEGNGGGAMAWGGLTAKYSTFSNNTADGRGGGLFSSGDITVLRSTIRGNHATSDGGATISGGSNETILLVNSTISENSATFFGALTVYGNAATDMAIINSTIALNRATPGSAGHPGDCRGAVQLSGDGFPYFESTIVANSTCDGQPSVDVYADSLSNVTLVGANNLIMESTLPVPADTLSIDPKLATLADNGGPTLTHALSSTSPAIDRGSNVLDLSHDQRGVGFSRVKGVRADIGSYEY